MELHRAACILCNECSKTLLSSDCEEYINKLLIILGKNNIEEKQFQELKSTIRLCPICCQKVDTVATGYTLHTKNNQLKQTLKRRVCCVCEEKKNLMKIENDWRYFTDRISIFIDISNEKQVLVCISCFALAANIYTIRNTFFKKYPEAKSVVLSSKASDRSSNKTSPKSIKNLKKKQYNNDGLFDNLSSLNKTKFKVAQKLKKDTLLYKSVPYVKLYSIKSEFKNIIEKPKIKIMLKKKNNRKKNKSIKKRVSSKKKKEDTEKVKDEERDNNEKSKLETTEKEESESDNTNEKEETKENELNNSEEMEKSDVTNKKDVEEPQDKTGETNELEIVENQQLSEEIKEKEVASNVDLNESLCLEQSNQEEHKNDKNQVVNEDKSEDKKEDEKKEQVEDNEEKIGTNVDKEDEISTIDSNGLEPILSSESPSPVEEIIENTGETSTKTNDNNMENNKEEEIQKYEKSKENENLFKETNFDEVNQITKAVLEKICTENIEVIDLENNVTEEIKIISEDKLKISEIVQKNPPSTEEHPPTLEISDSSEDEGRKRKGDVLDVEKDRKKKRVTFMDN